MIISLNVNYIENGVISDKFSKEFEKIFKLPENCEAKCERLTGMPQISLAPAA